MRALGATDVIFSLRRLYIEGLLSGSKCVELRRRAPILDPGTRVWLYSKIPDGEIIGVAVLDGVEVASPADLWGKYSACAGLGEVDFFGYFSGVDVGAALKFKSVAKLFRPISLQRLKELEPNFHPPQFFRRVVSPALQQELATSQTAVHRQPCDH